MQPQIQNFLEEGAVDIGGGRGMEGEVTMGGRGGVALR